MAEWIIAPQRMKLKPAQSVAANAREVLPKMARKYFRSGRDAVSAKRTPNELHGFRLHTKRFRYTLELFRPVYGPQLDRYLKALKALQGTLGKVSDYEAIQRVVPGDRPLQAHIRQALKRKVRDLRHEWRAFDSEGELKRWRTYLAGEHSKPRNASTHRTAPKKPAGRRRGSK
jgi:CHAD domain-containing protein